jgi:integrase
MRVLGVPTYREHKPTGRAVVTLSGKDIYLGKFGSPESRAEYNRRVSEWLARGRTRADAATVGNGSTVDEVLWAYVEYAEQNFRDADGRPTREAESMKLAFRPLRELYGSTPAAAFGPLSLQAVREKMIRLKLCRNVINQRVGYIKRFFRWASSRALVPAVTYHGLLSVEGLRRGRSGARETKPVVAVADAQVDAILPYLPPVLRAMLTLQRLTGMRTGELVQMRGCDLDMCEDVWLYRPVRHKTRYLGRERVVALGKQSQAAVEPYLKPDLSATLFSPRLAEAERNEIMRAARKTRVQPSQVSRRKSRPKREPGEAYTTRTYYAALRYAMRRAERAGRLSKDEFWHPHQLRHAVAKRIKRAQDAEAARAFLGHSKVDMTEHYAGMDTRASIDVARRFA